MTYEEALTELKKYMIKAEIPKVEAVAIGIETLEKQIPKKPKTRYGITYYCPPDCGGEEFDEYGDILICPSCGEDIENDKYCKHCKECGQALDDWSDSDDRITTAKV